MENKIAFLAYFDQDNLGVGYLSSILLKNDFQIMLVDIKEGEEAILQYLKRSNPLIVGFSIIFQYQIYDFKDLIDFLRTNGIGSHFTAGGHYPSLKYIDLMELITELDSIVLFEGEYTLLELARRIKNKNDLSDIPGLALRKW